MDRYRYSFIRIICIFMFCVFCFSPLLCFADTEQITDSDENINSDYPSIVYINSDDYSEVLDDIKSGVDMLNDPIYSGDITGDLINTSETILRVSASDSNGLKSVLLSIIGDYETVITDYEYRNNNNTYTTHSISIERDWAWICSCAVFGGVIWCVFRGVVAILCRN